MNATEKLNLQSSDLDVEEIWQALTFRWRTIVIFSLSALALGFVYAFWLAQPVYVANSAIALKNTFYRASGGQIERYAQSLDNQTMSLEAQRIVSFEILDELIGTLELGQDAEFNSALEPRFFGQPSEERPTIRKEVLFEALHQAITITIPQGTNIIEISVTSKSAEKSMIIANSLVDIYVLKQGVSFFEEFLQENLDNDSESELPAALLNQAQVLLRDLEMLTPKSNDEISAYLEQLDTVFKSLVGLYGYHLSNYQVNPPGDQDHKVSTPHIFSEVIQAAYIPNAAASPKKMRILLISLVLGVFGSVALVLAEAISRGRIYDERILQRRFGIPVWSEFQMRVLQDVNGQLPTQTPYEFHELRSALTLNAIDSDRIGAVLFLNAGKHIPDVKIALGLGQSYASIGRKALIIAEHLDKKFLRDLDLDETQSCFQEALSVGHAAETAILKTGSVDMIGVASSASDAWDIYSTHAFAEALEKFKQDYDIVILASQSDMSTEGMSVLQKHSNMVQINIVEGETCQRDVTRLISKIKTTFPSPVGFVLLKRR